MKTSTIFLILLVFAITKINAQDYYIAFVGAGDTSSVSKVTVENLTSGAIVTLSGNDMLHLTSFTGIVDPDFASKNIHIYPNPMAGQSTLTFYAKENGYVVISLIDISGKTISQFSKLLSPGSQNFHISGIKPGMYFVRVSGNNYTYSTKLLSQSKQQGYIRIEYVSSLTDNSAIHLKSTSFTVDMPYTEGDRLLYTITSGKYSTITTDVPTGSKTIASDFVACTDADNNNYSTVKIGSQVWMAENLKTTRFIDGTSIPKVTDNATWQNLDTPAYTWYNNDSVTYHKPYGVLYNGFTFSTSKLAPKDWHVPSDDEWGILLGYIEGVAGKLKESGTTHWVSPNTGASNEVGFNALPGSALAGDGFGSIGTSAWWWSSTANSDYTGGCLNIEDNSIMIIHPVRKGNGFSIRCIKDELDTTISTKLTGGASKTWVVDKDVEGHMGVGPWNTSVTPEWWYAQVNEKLLCCPCFYTSTFTFTKVAADAYSLIVATPDGAFTKTGVLAGGLPGIPASGNEDCYNYAGGISACLLITASSGIPAPSSTKTSILLSGINTFIGYGATQKEYEILKITDSTLYLRVQGTEPGNAWYLKLKALNK